MKSSEKWAKAYQKNNIWQFRNGMKLYDLIAPQPNETVLDIGCGTGELTYKFAQGVIPHGSVIAIDPDHSRLQIAEKNIPQHLSNIFWKNSAIEDVQEVLPHSLDIIYSNYVLHWVKDQNKVLKQIATYLKSGGRFCMQTVIDTPTIVKEITLLMGSRGKALLNQLNFTNSIEWQKMLVDAGFDIEKIEEVDDYHFANFDEFIEWWGATTNGMFSRDYVNHHELNMFSDKFKDGMDLYGKETLRVLARKQY